MALRGVGIGFLAGDHVVVDVPPMIRRNIRRIDAKRVHGIDQGQHPLDLWPAIDTQQDLTARTNEGHGLERFATSDSAQDVEPRDDGAVIVGGPADEGEDAFGAKPTRLRRRSMICSKLLWPKRIQRSTFRFWKVSSTNVVKGAGPSANGRSCAPRPVLPIMTDLLRWVETGCRAKRAA